MRSYWVIWLGMVALLTTGGCKQREPVPGPKAPGAAVEAAGIAWFQGSFDEAFSRPSMHATCSEVRAPMTPVTPDLLRGARVRAPALPAAPAVTTRRPLV